MGDWGAQPWDSDEAADWFQRFWKQGWSLVEQEVEEFDPAQERYDSLRAAAYVLATFGGVYTAPTSMREKLPGLIDKSESRLYDLLQSSDFADIYGNDPDVRVNIESQIAALRSLHG